jgi:NYN domain
MHAGGVLHVDIQYTGRSRANTDMRLAVSALEAAFRERSCCHFVILSDDRDFLPLVRSLQTLSHHVTLVNTSDNSNALRFVADDWVCLADDFASMDCLQPDGGSNGAPVGESRGGASGHFSQGSSEVSSEGESGYQRPRRAHIHH